MKNAVLQRWQLLVVILSGIVNREQQRVIDFLRTENQVFREQYGKKRIMLNDDQRRRLAVKGKYLSRKTLEEVATIVTPDTIMRWHRKPRRPSDATLLVSATSIRDAFVAGRVAYRGRICGKDKNCYLPRRLQ